MGNIFIAIKACSTCITFIFLCRVYNLGEGPTVGSRVERCAQIGGKGLIAFRGRVKTNITEVSTGCERATKGR